MKEDQRGQMEQKVTVKNEGTVVWIEYWKADADKPYRRVKQFTGTVEACEAYVKWLEESKAKHQERWPR